MWVKDGIYYSRDPNTDQIHKAIEYKTFMEMEFDVIIASIPQHIEPFKKLAKDKNAKFIFQVGNEFPFDYDSVPNLMASIMPRALKCHNVFYHQEFDTNVLKPLLGKKPKEIHNYMNVLHNYPRAYDYFIELEKAMQEYTFKMYGSQNRDGCISGVRNLAESMQRAKWIYHHKPGGDGYGHIAFNTLACGVPIITNKRDYEGKLFGSMIDDKSSVILDGMTPSELADYIRNKEENYDTMRQVCYSRFTENVDFNKEAIEIQKFLDNLVK